MDPKASAKSKRSHTQHGRKAHPHPASIAHKKKAAAANADAAGGGEKRTSHPSLPSNWDRYDDVTDEIVDVGADPKHSGDGEVAPKSKGADFGYLMEQARSQPKDFIGYEDEQLLPFDFIQGASSMLFARGKSLLSLCGDDNFIVDDDPTSSFEVPFLSMDLHALAAQLSKLKLSQRLFIESDLLPEELNSEESKTSPASKKSRVSKPAAFDSGVLHSQTSPNLTPALEKNTNQTRNNSSMYNDGRMNTSAGEKDKPHISSLHPIELEASKSSIREVQELRNDTPLNSEQKKTTRFEAELDMLLDSFSQTSLSSSIPDDLVNKNSALSSPSIDLSAPLQDPESSRNVAKTSFDDSIDDLLAETSLWIDDLKKTAPPHEQPIVSGLYTSQGSGSSTDIGTTPLDDSIDDLLALPLKQGAPSSISFPQILQLGSRSTNSIDDLLAETSASVREQKKLTTVEQKEGNVSSSAGFSIQGADHDFDSWLDSL